MALRDIDNTPLPSGPRLAAELWAIAFPDEPYDGRSDLQQVYQVAASSQPTQTGTFLQRRLCVASQSIPEAYKYWTMLPWKGIYTINVDNYFAVGERRFAGSRRMAVSSALKDEHSSDALSKPDRFLEVIQLNGRIDDYPNGVTFSHEHYAERIRRHDVAYDAFVSRLLTHPFVFVGSELDEDLLWYHLQLRKERGQSARELRPKSFLVSPSISKPRQVLLERDYNVAWIPLTALQFAEQVLSRLEPSIPVGLVALKARATDSSHDRVLLPEVANFVAQATNGPSNFLEGDQPNWDDIVSGRAVARGVDDCVYQAATTSLGSISSATSPGAIVVLTGTAASGKSASLMRLAARLSNEGRRVAWVGAEADVSGKRIRNYSESDSHATVLAIEDADRYGSDLAVLAHEAVAARAGQPRAFDLVLLAIRSSRIDRCLNPALLNDISVQEITMPNLTDGDITSLLAILEREGLLRRLAGMSPANRVLAFKERANRQLLVAMLEAVTGRPFEEKVYDEWRDLTQVGRLVYAVVAIASVHRFTLTREQVLLALEEKTNASLNVLDDLVRRNLLSALEGGRIRARHRHIAEVLLNEMRRHGDSLSYPLSRLAFTASVGAVDGVPRGSEHWRLFIRVISHKFIADFLSLEQGRDVYATIEELRRDDYHYWLQRGCLEIEASGDVGLADRYLSTARSLCPGADPLVETEYAYMLFCKACKDPSSPDAAPAVVEGTRILMEQIASRGPREPHPFHVLGTQSLAWNRRMPASSADKLAHLEPILKELERAVGFHPRLADIRQIRDHVRQEVWALKGQIT